MAETPVITAPRAAGVAPTGAASLSSRRRYLRRRSQRRRLGDRGVTGLWLVAAAVLSWLFVVGFTSLAH